MSDVVSKKGPRACTTCAKAKSRCVPGPVPDICERCHRLKKPCGVQTPAPARKHRAGSVSLAPEQAFDGACSTDAEPQELFVRMHPDGIAQPQRPRNGTGRRVTRVAELERRLEDLTSRLESTTWLQQSPPIQQQQQKMQQQQPLPRPRQPLTPVPTPVLSPSWPSAPKTGCVASSLFFTDVADNNGRNGSSLRRESDISPSSNGSASSSIADDEGQPHAFLIPPMVYKNKLVVSPSVANLRETHAAARSATQPATQTASQRVSGNERWIENINSLEKVLQRRQRLAEGSRQRSLTPPNEAGQCAELCRLRTEAEAPSFTSPRPTSASAPASASASASTPWTGGESATMSLRTTPTSDGGLATSGLGGEAAVAWPDGEEAEALLEVYRESTQITSPFVVVPTHVNAAQLRAEQPFLWKAIMMARVAQDGRRQIQLGKRLLHEVAAAAFLQPHKKLELLQAVLLLLGCFHYNIESFQLNNLLFLARALCVSLGINDPPATSRADLDTWIRQQHSTAALERMRTFVGTFYIEGMVTTTARKADAMQSSAFLDACCAVLERQQEYSSDVLLVQLVRVQQLSQRIARAYSDSYNHGDGLLSLLQRLEQELAAFRAQIPPDLRNNNSLLGHLHIAEILVYEAVVQDDTAFSSGPDGNSTRLALLCQCRDAINRFMENRFSEPLTDRSHCLCLASFDFIYAFLTSLKLMVLQVPGWDPRRVRVELNFDGVVTRQIDDMRLLAAMRRAPINCVDGKNGWYGKDANGENRENDDADALSMPATREAFVQQDPFVRLARRLTELKAMLDRELEKLPPSDGGGVAVPLSMPMMASVPTPTAALYNSLDDSVVAPMVSGAGPSDAPTPVTAMMTSSALDAERRHDTRTADDPGLDTYMFDAEPILNFADATVDFMNNADMSWLWTDMAGIPAWDTVGSPGMHPGPLLDAWSAL